MALPKFARNYTRPGAYESPNTPIDTQSGAIIAQAISNIGNITANFINNQNKAVSAENAAIKKSLNAINKKATEQKGELATKIGEHGSAQNSNYAEVGVGIIDYLEQQQTLLSQYKRNNDSENISKTEDNIFKANIGYGNVLQLIQSTPDALTTYGEDAASANLGGSGGVALTGQGKQSSEYWLGMAAFGGSAEGAYSKLNYDFDEHKLSLNLDSVDISKNQKSFTGSDKFDPSFKGITVDPLAFINSDPGVVPDIKTTAIKLLGRKTEDNPNGLNLVGSNGQVNDLQYYDTNKPSEVKEIAGKVYVKYAYNEKVLADTLAAPVNSNLVVPFTTSSDVSRANMINTNIYSQPMMIPDSNIANKNGSPLSVEDQINFEKNTMAYTMSLIPQPKEFVFDKDEYYNITKKTAEERKATKTAKESETNYNIAKKLINQEGKIPDVPAQPNFFDVSGQLTREGNRFKEAVSTIVTGSNGKLVEFVESERTGDPSARVKYPGQPEIEISLAEFRNKDLFDAKIQKATGSGTSGLETYYDINLD